MPRLGTSRKQVKRKDDLPEVYKDMLAEAEASSSPVSDEKGSRVKRRRIGGRLVAKGDHHFQDDTAGKQTSLVDSHEDLNDLCEDVVTQRPTIIKSDSDETAESDHDWEEVDLQPHVLEQSHSNPPTGESEELNLILDDGGVATTPASRKGTRKPLTATEKELRLAIHKTHLCCLLAHVFLRNHWCNDNNLHLILRRILNKKCVSYLNPSEEMSQFQRSRSFMDGLEQASEIFRQRFKKSSKGMERPFWAENIGGITGTQQPGDADLPVMKEDFLSAAQQLKASRDVGAQLFCALLRSVGVEARLVCSLQVLPFGSSPPPASSMLSKYAEYYLTEYVEPRRSKAESGCPVYWVEAFNEAVQKWIPVDPLVTKSIAKPSKFEPAASDRGNQMTYVVGFEDDGSAHDVTRRYAKAYNAKTRRDRVESTKGGERWWRKATKPFRRQYRLDRDQVDDAELSKKEAAEPMPRNVQDFKYHPYYALERHLRRHEVIHPKREVGKVGAGKSLEPIFRRQDVRHVQSADKWYRTMGREVKLGEQPLKRIPAKKARHRFVHSDDEAEEDPGTSLYAIDQTTPYTAPPVTNGRVPRNIYGNIDIYVPSMIPPGGSHIKHPDTIRAAKILGIDFAEAITGFTFRGRHGTAVSQGAIIASENYDAVEAILSALEDERIQAEEAERSREALRMWKRLLAGLRIRERIEGYEVEGERDAIDQTHSQLDEDEDYKSDEGGGFFPAQEAENLAEPTSHRPFRQQDTIDTIASGSGGFVRDDPAKQSEGTATRAADPFLDSLDDDDGGGFLVEDDYDEDAEDALESSMQIDANGSIPLATAPSHTSPTNNEGFLPIERENIQYDVEAKTGESDHKSNTSLQEEHHINESSLGGNLTQAELDEARLLQQLHESQHFQAQPFSSEASVPLEEPHYATSQEEEGEPETERHEIGSNPAAAATATSPSRAKSTPLSETESPKSDKSSLLSEDPEDEDAEPDWLV